MRDWLTRLISFRDRPLQDRLAVLVAAAVASAVAITGVAAWLLTNVAVYNQLDSELIDVAAVTANWVAVDIEGMGGLDTNALKAANVTVMLVRADGRVTSVPGATVTVVPGVEELSVARRQQHRRAPGWRPTASRTGSSRSRALSRAPRSSPWCSGVRRRPPTTSWAPWPGPWRCSACWVSGCPVRSVS